MNFPALQLSYLFSPWLHGFHFLLRVCDDDDAGNVEIQTRCRACRRVYFVITSHRLDSGVTRVVSLELFAYMCLHMTIYSVT